MKKTQEYIRKWNSERGWGDFNEIKDLLLNINEEVGEFWNIIKWINDKNTLKDLIKENKEIVSDFIGDTLYLIFKIANICNVDAKKSIDKTMEEYKKRFPLKETKGRHGNVLAGGIDKK